MEKPDVGATNKKYFEEHFNNISSIEEKIYKKE